MAELSSSGEHRVPGHRSLLRAAVDDISRLAFITNVLVKHGFSAFAVRGGFLSASDEVPPADTIDPRADPDDAARRFRSMLEDLGPTFVKVGQVLSTRPDVLPPPFVRELARLQDQAPPVEFDAIRQAVEDGLGMPIEEVFTEFDPEPVASASMAQTHLATMHDGVRVIVKVQRPGIAETMRSDLDLLHIFARLLEMTVAEMELYAPGDVVRVLDEALRGELDFLNESLNLETLSEAFADDPDFRIPRLYRELTTRTVMTMEYVSGSRIRDLEQGSEDAERYSLLLVEALYRMIFDHGIFHGDPHPGNLIVADDGRLAFIDFGLCGYLTVTQRDRLVTLIIAVLAGDIDSTARVLLRMGRPLGHVQMSDFKAEVAAIRERYLKRNLKTIDMSRFMEECLDSAARHRIRIATDYSILSKAAVTIEGVVRSLAPELDLFDHSRTYQRRLLADQYSAERLLKGGVAGAIHLGNFLRDVPEQIGQVLMDLETGRFQVAVKSDGPHQLAQELNRQGTRIVMGLCAAGLTIATPLFFAHERWWIRDQIPVLTTLSALSAMTFAFWGLAWHVMGGRSRDMRIRLAPLLRFLRR